MAGDGKVDSNFFIFLPHVFTSEPVADIERGPRYSCFVGELLNFFLIAQFRGRRRAQENELQEWQNRLLRLSTSVSVSCVDLGMKKDDDVNSIGGFTNCSPVASSRIKGEGKIEGTQASNPVVTARGDIIYPLKVSLDVLPVLSRRIRLSVNVWTPELNAAVQLDNGSPWSDYLDFFINNDPDNALVDIQSSFRCHVNATLPVVCPPTIRCKYTNAASKHYLAVEVINSLGEPITVHQVSVHSSSNSTSNTNKRCLNHLHIKNQQKRLFYLHALPYTPDDGPSCLCPLTLYPWEHSSFVFRILQQEASSSHHKHMGVALLSSVTWSVQTLTLRHQKLTTRYSLPLFDIRSSSVSVRAAAKSIVNKGKRFQVKYTVTNTEEEDCNVYLTWQPNQSDSLLPGMHNINAESLVCLQPTIRIGCCPSGSSQTVHVEFLAVQEGLHEVGQFMTCKWYGEGDESTPLGNLSQLPRGTRGLTTLSHSCQVFVIDDE